MIVVRDRGSPPPSRCTPPTGGWLGWAVTLPEYRRRGAQSTLVARRVADAAEAGCPIVTVDTAADLPGSSDGSLVLV